MSLVGPLLPSLNVEEVPECERGGRWLWSDWSDEARGEGEDHHSPNRPPPHHFPVNISQDTLGKTETHWDTLDTADQQYSQLMIVWLSQQLSDHFMRNTWLLTNTFALEPLKISYISSLIAYTRLLPVNPYYPPIPCLKVCYIFLREVFKILKRRMF